jgi:hypothetical protein
VDGGEEGALGGDHLEAQAVIGVPALVVEQVDAAAVDVAHGSGDAMERGPELLEGEELEQHLLGRRSLPAEAGAERRVADLWARWKAMAR